MHLGGKDDKRQITACFAGTMTGDFLEQWGHNARLHRWNYLTIRRERSWSLHWITQHYCCLTIFKLSVWKRYSGTLILIMYSYVILIPPNCTDRLQPLDISVNKPAKDFLRQEFQDWYSKKICHQFQGLESKEPVDLRFTIMKPLGAQWMISLHKYLKSKPQII